MHVSQSDRAAVVSEGDCFPRTVKTDAGKELFTVDCLNRTILLAIAQPLYCPHVQIQLHCQRVSSGESAHQ